MTNTNIAALILFFEKPEQTLECIKSLLPHALDIYLLNNGSSTEAREIVWSYCQDIPNVTLIDSPVNLGVAGGRNKLIAEASAYEWLFFLDNDMVALSPNMIERFHQYIQDNRDIDIFIGNWYELHLQAPGLSIQYFTYQEDYNGKKRTCFSEIAGGVTFMRKKLFDEFGLLDNEMRIGFEDYEFAKRIRKTGKDIKAVLMEDVCFAHDHRYMKRQEDRQAVEYRYAPKSYEKSLQIMQERFDWNITLDEEGLKKQQKLMLEKPDFDCHASPNALSLYMTQECNFKCSWCYRNTVGLKETVPPMTVHVVKRILQAYPDVAHIAIAGQGEPTLTPEFKEIVRHLRDQGKQINLITNGTNIKPILEVIDLIDDISISLYGSSDKRYQQYCNTSAFSTVSNNYHTLRSLGKNISLSYILDKHDMEELANVVNLCDTLLPSILRIHNALWYDVKDTKQKEKILTTQDVDVINTLEDLCIDRKYVIQKPLAINLNAPINSCRCYCRIMTIDGAGNINGCGRQYIPSNKVGNIFRDEDCFNSEEMMRFRHNQLLGMPAHPECVFCFGNWGVETSYQECLRRP